MRLSPRFPRRGLFLGAPAYSRRMSWDVRARNLFNAVNAECASDPNSKVLRANGLNSLQPVLVRMDNASLASQAVAPPLGDHEMGAVGRTFQDIGKRLNTAQPLRLQRVADGSRGLNTIYRAMIEAAFQRAWWQSNLMVVIDQSGALSFVARLRDDAYFRRRSHRPLLRRHLDIFTGEAACSEGHAGAELADNSVRILFGAIVNGVKQPAEIVERMFNGDYEVVAYDQGLYNLGLRPTAEDLGGGNNDSFGNPLTFINLLTTPRSQIFSQELFDYAIPNIASPLISIGERVVTQATFKNSPLRTSTMTASGPFAKPSNSTIAAATPAIRMLTEAEIDDLTAFLSRPARRPAKRSVRPSAIVRVERTQNARYSPRTQQRRHRPRRIPRNSRRRSPRGNAT